MADKLVHDDEELEVIEEEGVRKKKDPEPKRRGGCGCWWVPVLAFIIIFVIFGSQILGIFSQVLWGGEKVTVTGLVTREFSQVMSGTEQHLLQIDTVEDRFDGMYFQLAKLDQIGFAEEGDYVTVDGRIVTVLGQTVVLVDEINAAEQ